MVPTPFFSLISFLLSLPSFFSPHFSLSLFPSPSHSLSLCLLPFLSLYSHPLLLFPLFSPFISSFSAPSLFFHLFPFPLFPFLPSPSSHFPPLSSLTISSTSPNPKASSCLPVPTQPTSWPTQSSCWPLTCIAHGSRGKWPKVIRHIQVSSKLRVMCSDLHVTCMWHACDVHVVYMWLTTCEWLHKYVACDVHVMCMWLACDLHVMYMYLLHVSGSILHMYVHL